MLTNQIVRIFVCRRGGWVKHSRMVTLENDLFGLKWDYCADLSLNIISNPILANISRPNWLLNLNHDWLLKTDFLSSLQKWPFLNIQRNKTIHFYRNYFLSDAECPQTEDTHRNFGSPKQTVVIGIFYFSRICLGLPKFRLGPPFGDIQNPRENYFYRNGLSCYAV